MSRLKILLAEDDRGLGMIVKAFLDAQGYPTTLCQNGEEAWNSLRDVQYDLCITDVMMPVMDGFTLLKQIKAMLPTMPVIVLTARKEQDDVLEGFALGADDYITKPFSMDELLARVKVWERWLTYTPGKTESCEFRIGSFTFNVPHLTLTDAKGGQIKLTSKEMELLYMLCERMGETLERRQVLQTIWEEENRTNARSMDVYITKLRKYFKDDPDVDIVNVHGVGFKLVVK
jgi:DNA-binding response OmpR family regulator